MSEDEVKTKDSFGINQKDNNLLTSKEDKKIVGNLEIHQNDKYIVVSVNPKIYPLSVIYSAAYVFLEKAYVILDGNPDEEILVELRYMEENKDIEKLGRDFNNELINYAVFQYNSEQSKTVKEEIIKKALSTNIVQSPEILNQECEEEDYKEEDYKEDSLGIAVPWDEKYGDKKND